MNTLSWFRCLLNLEENTLTFRDYADLGKILFDKMYETAIVEGQEVKVLIDTGTSFHLVGSTDLAKQLNLPLENISHLNHVFETNYGDVPINYVAEKIHMKVKDREFGQAFYFVNDVRDKSSTVLGMSALNGALIQFNHDGTYELSLSGELDEEEETRAVDAFLERDKSEQQAEAEEEPRTSVSD